MIERIKKLFTDEEGATMVEYALLIALIAIVAMVALLVLGPAVRDKFQYAADEINEAPNN